MDERRPLMVAVFIQVINGRLYVVSEAAFKNGLSTFMFVFYRQAAALVLLAPIAILLERKSYQPLKLPVLIKVILHALVGITFSLNMYNMGLKYTSATVASASVNAGPVITFLLAVFLRMETMEAKSLPGILKILGITLCLAGTLTIVFYKGPHINSLNHHNLLDHHTSYRHHVSASSKATWIKGSFLVLSSTATWSLWLVLQGLIVTVVSYYLQTWCIEKKGPVFLAMSTPLALIFTIACSLSFLGEQIHLGSVLGGLLLVGGLYSVLWGKSKEITACEVSIEDGKPCIQKEATSTSPTS